MERSRLNSCSYDKGCGASSRIGMLVLSRKVGERILIGDQITVTVVRVTGGGVRLGIEAPSEMAVIREELQHDLQQPPVRHSPHHPPRS